MDDKAKINAAVVKTHAKEIKWLVRGGGQAPENLPKPQPKPNPK